VTQLLDIPQELIPDHHLLLLPQPLLLLIQPLLSFLPLLLPFLVLKVFEPKTALEFLLLPFSARLVSAFPPPPSAYSPLGPAGWLVARPECSRH
jgi:hypothetical protein